MSENPKISPLVRSLKWHITILKIAGLWVPDDESKIFLANLWGIFVYFFLIVLQPIAAIYNFIVIRINFADVLVPSYMLIEQVCFIFKMGVMMKRKVQIKKCIYSLNSDRFYTEGDNENIKNTCATSVYICKLFLISCIIVDFAWLSSAGLRKEPQLPANMWLPFGLSDHRYSYACTYFYEIIASECHAIFNAGVDAVLGSLMKQATGQIQILKENILNLHKNSKGEDDFDDEEVYKRICFCLKHYQNIYEYVTTVQYNLGLLPFTQFIYSAIVICISAYNIITLKTSEFELYAIITFLCCILTELLLYCWFGEELDYESKTLNTTIYFSKWCEFGPKSKKALIIFMERAKRPMNFKAGGLFPLSLSTFMMVLQRSYSLLAVLRKTF